MRFRTTGLGALVLCGVATYVAAGVYLAGWVILPMIGVGIQNHTTWVWVDYWFQFPQLRTGAALHSLVGCLLGVGALGGWLISGLWKDGRSLHGDARFATRPQIAKAGLNAADGIIVGQQGSRYLVYGGQQHVFLAAPTRSGKGVGIAIPNLLSWRDSVVVTDIKGENWDITAGFRHKHGQSCYFFSPTRYETHRYNPLSYIDPDPNKAVDDIQKIASMLYPEMPGVDPIWNASCRAMFLGLVLYLRETPGKPVTLGEVLRCTMTRTETSRHLKDIIDSREADGNPLSPLCVQALMDFISCTSENTRSSIKKTFTSRLELWLNPIIDAATSESDFDLRKLRTERMSLYIGITPDDLDRLAPLVNLLCQQAIDLNTRQLPSQNSALKYSVLFVLDEFTAFGRIGVLAKGISYVAGYGLRMLPIVQSPAQIRDVYGREAADTFMVNHAVQIVFAPREFRVAQEISESLGFQTVKARSVSKKLDWWKEKQPSESVSDHRRALLLPQEVRDIGEEHAILLVEGTPPIKCKKIRYFRDKTFTRRVLPAPKVPRIAVNANRIGSEGETAVRDAATVREPGSETPASPRLLPNGEGQTMQGSGRKATNSGARSRTHGRRKHVDWGTQFPTTVAMLNEIRAQENTKTTRKQMTGLSLDFSDVELPTVQVTEEELRRLHATFMGEAGVTG
jgi:type IV secretion system protein VirD4